MSYLIPSDRDSNKGISVNTLPDYCPQCRAFGEQVRVTVPMFAKSDPSNGDAWVAFRCPRAVCRLPYFAVYKRQYGHGLRDPDFTLMKLLPFEPPKQAIDATIAALSPSFYRILNQAIAADEHDLDLIAGMGYRKALEFLAKDYVVASKRQERNDALESGNAARVAELDGEISSILKQLLGAIIVMIPDELTKEVARRAAWLGNDESHYTRIWTKHDIEDLKKLLGLVISFIGNESTAKKMIASMDQKNPG